MSVRFHCNGMMKRFLCARIKDLFEIDLNPRFDYDNGFDCGVSG